MSMCISSQTYKNRKNIFCSKRKYPFEIQSFISNKKRMNSRPNKRKRVNDEITKNKKPKNYYCSFHEEKVICDIYDCSGGYLMNISCSMPYIN